MHSESEIHALIQLLDDSDPIVFKHVHDKLLSLGAEVIPFLEQAWGAELHTTVHERIEEIIREIQFNELVKDWENWLQLESPDLLTGAFLIARYHYPEISLQDIQKKIFKLRQSIWLEINNNQTPLEQVQIFNQVFFSQYDFKGLQAISDYQDFCVNAALHSKKGNAICIGIIYQIVANELNLPVYGVTLIRHYVLAFCKKLIFDFNTSENLEREVAFYVNPVNKGSVFSRNEIKDYLQKLNIEKDSKYFSPAGNLLIISELLKYLIEIYQHQNRPERVKDLSRLQESMK